MRPIKILLALPLAIMISLGGFFTSSFNARAALIDRIEASVNAALILHSDIGRFQKTFGLRTQLDPLFAGTALASRGSGASPKEIVEFLIDEKMILQQFSVADSEVEQEINSIQSNNKIDRASLIRALQEQGYSFDEYFELIRVTIAKRNMVDRDIRTKVSISEDDIKNYFFNHYAKGSATPRSYQVKIITITPQNYKSAATARETAERALKELRGGETFEDVARKLSDDPTAESGGDLGILTEDQMSPLIREQTKKLQIGKISDIVVAPSGALMILKLIDVRSGETERYEKAKEDIRSQLAAAEYQHQISLWLERQRQSAFIHRTGEPSVVGLPNSKS
jgi:peptidyl-prolyl cis-trans isomerase SurA